MQVFYYHSSQKSLDLKPVQLAKTAHTLDDSSLQLPAGVYTTIRTYPSLRVLFFELHIQRLERSAYLTGQSIQIDRDRLRQAIYTVLLGLNRGEQKIRITVIPEKDASFGVYLAFSDLSTPSAQDRQQGVTVNTSRMKRENSEAKVTAFIKATADTRQMLPKGINELLMVEDRGVLLEGLTSNIFCVEKGTLWTAEKDVLPGITRQVVIDLIHKQWYALVFSGYPYDKIRQVDEVFITSTSRAVLPVTCIDGSPVGNGKPGPITQKLAGAYNLYIESQLEPLYSDVVSSSEPS